MSEPTRDKQMNASDPFKASAVSFYCFQLGRMLGGVSAVKRASTKELRREAVRQLFKLQDVVEKDIEDYRTERRAALQLTDKE